MNQTDVSRLQDVFRAVLNLPAGTDVTGASPTTIPSWDSLGHVMLVAAMESEFGIQIDPGDSLELKSYQDAARLLERLGS